MWAYLSNHSSESIHILVMRTLEGLLPANKFWPQGSYHGMGFEVKNLRHFKKCYSAFSFMLAPSKDIKSDIRYYDQSSIWHWYLCLEVTVSVTYISWLSDFA